MADEAKETCEAGSIESSEDELREELYDQFDISTRGRLAIRYILPLLEATVQTESRYDIDPRSKILAEISLYQAYEKEPKFKMFAWASVLIGSYDLLHPLNPTFYGILFAALATLNGFVSSLRSPQMMAAELEGITDDEGMPADYRSTALSSVNTNITLILFIIAVSVQLVVTSSVIQGEIMPQNIADTVFPPAASALALFSIPFILDRVRDGSEKD